ncbi:MAG: hypothetical protein J6A62_01115 [Oscillospiraceae bacterium]|nr:hypothetical protein [Oscillospiraceae bacterium]
MTLKELAVSYRESARLLDTRIRELRQRKAQTDSPDERCGLEGRIRELETMHREMQGIARHCEHYYERGYRRNAKYTI